MGGRHVLHFQPRAPRTILAPRITRGDIVAIRQTTSRTTTTSNPSTQSEGIVTALNPKGIEITSDSPLNPEHGDDGQQPLFLVVKITSDVTHNRCIAALTDLQRVADDPSHFAHPVVQALLQDAAPSFTTAAPPPPSADLNDEQQEAINRALAAKHVAVIHGPPGTGKTHTLVRYIRLEAARASRLLVVAPSNTAVDNIAERLSDMDVACAGSRVRFVRAGHAARISPRAAPHALERRVAQSDDAHLAADIRKELDALRASQRPRAARTEERRLRRELRARESRAVSRVLAQAHVVLATIAGTGSRILDSTLAKPFDVVVIDEAAQALEAATWLPILRGRKVVFAGDPFQLAGTVKSPVAEERGLQKSILDRIFAKESLSSCVHMLNIQYRMHSIICQWSSDEFYGGKLSAHESVASRRVSGLEGWVAHAQNNDHEDDEDDESLTFPFIVVDTAGGDCEESEDVDMVGGNSKKDVRGIGGGSRRNEGEAAIVCRLIETLLKKGVRKQDVGIISPYAGQVQLIRKMVRGRHEDDGLEVATVDSFQGREKEIVILSLVRSNEGGEIGFLSDARRLNVAITRAKRCVIVVCDSETVCSNALFERLVAYGKSAGVYRSGVVEFEDIVGTFSLGRRPKEAIEARGHPELQTDVRDDGKAAAKGSRRGPRGSHCGKGAVSGGETGKRNGGAEKEDEDERLREELVGDMENFMANELVVDKQFAKTLSSTARRLVHEIAEELGLGHASEGNGEMRQIRVWKEGGNRVDLRILGEITDDGAFDVGDDVDVDLGLNRLEVSEIAEDAKQEQKEQQGQEEDETQEEKVAQNTTAQKGKGKKKKKKKKTGKQSKSNAGNEEEEDFDKMLQEFGWNEQRDGGGGANASSAGRGFSPTVASIVNGVLVRPVGGTSGTASGTAQRGGNGDGARRQRLEKRIAEQREDRSRKGGRRDGDNS